MAGYWPFSFCVFIYGPRRSQYPAILTSRLVNNIYIYCAEKAKRKGQYPAILTELAWSIKDILHGIKSTEKMIFVLVIWKSDNAFRFSRFLVPSRQRNHRESFYCHGKYFAKENFRTPALTSAYSGQY